MMDKPVNWIAIISLCILALIAAMGYAVFFRDGSGEQLKTIYAQSLLLGLAAVTGYWLNSSADVAKKSDDAAKKPTPQVDVPEQTLDVLPPTKEQP